VTGARAARQGTRIVIWSSSAAAGLLLVAFLGPRWGSTALTSAAAVLVVVCIAVCVWAAVVSDRSTDNVRRQITRFAQARRLEQEAGRHSPAADPEERAK
jgi:hypothetical protein